MSRRAAALVLGAVLAGCALTGKPPPAIQYYVLSVPGTPQTPLPGPVEVHRFTADQPFATERIAYRSSPYRIDYYVYNRWAADPRSMVASAVRDYLDRQPRSTDAAPFVVSGHVRRLEEVDEGKGRRGTVAVDLKIERDGQVLLEHDYSETEPSESETIEGVVAALSRALGRILDQAAGDVAAATPRSGERQLSHRPQSRGSGSPK